MLGHFRNYLKKGKTHLDSIYASYLFIFRNKNFLQFKAKGEENH